MIEGILLSFLLVSDCADFLRSAADGSPRAIVKASTISTHELATAIRMPAKMDGLVALLFQGKNIRLYGVVNANHDGFERIEAWGFERLPRQLFSLNAEGVVQKLTDDATIVTALVDVPRLERLLIDKSIIPKFGTDQKWKLKVQTFDKIDEELRTAEQIPVWGEIYRTLHENRLNDEYKYEATKGRKVFMAFRTKAHQEAAIPEPANRERRSIEFGGWLPDQHTAALIIQQLNAGSGIGLRIYAHPKFKSNFDPAFPNLAHRIALEGRFELSWLGLSNPTVIETEAEILRDGDTDRGVPPVLSDNMIMVFEEGISLPPRLPFYKLDPTTGLRISGRHLLAMNMKR